ncbi:MAG TPA: flavodoxin family protein [Syntrophales bacterium]|nr:flavodoxin family protein [Syntrophales bacterium]HOU77872.1 flavodoxin family protein [Syntrophales bacterium]HPC31747.1 flavodoxin family protein [Syntrophales bacterium]HQG34454.1 flavodoxin family protein [Syntrophales bacterium]HQI34582.1 flavodoxin family protein [Syntrophales bacterium]
MKILIINGNTKKSGFIADALAIVSSYLEANHVDVKNIRLYDADIRDCIGCFHCLKTGKCVLPDDMHGIIGAMHEASGFVIGAPVRNGSVTACYKRFYERITYTLGFPLFLEDKTTLAISSVGYMGGKKINRNYLGLQSLFHTRLSGFLFYRTGIPTRLKGDDIRTRLEKSAGKLIADISTPPPRGLAGQILFTLERTVMRKLMFEKNPEVYAHVIKSWREKGYM